MKRCRSPSNLIRVFYHRTKFTDSKCSPPISTPISPVKYGRAVFHHYCNGNDQIKWPQKAKRNPSNYYIYYSFNTSVINSSICFHIYFSTKIRAPNGSHFSSLFLFLLFSYLPFTLAGISALPYVFATISNPTCTFCSLPNISISSQALRLCRSIFRMYPSMPLRGPE